MMEMKEECRLTELYLKPQFLGYIFMDVAIYVFNEGCSISRSRLILALNDWAKLSIIIVIITVIVPTTNTFTIINKDGLFLGNIFMNVVIYVGIFSDGYSFHRFFIVRSSFNLSITTLFIPVISIIIISIVPTTSTFIIIILFGTRLLVQFFIVFTIYSFPWWMVLITLLGRLGLRTYIIIIIIPIGI